MHILIRFNLELLCEREQSIAFDFLQPNSKLLLQNAVKNQLTFDFCSLISKLLLQNAVKTPGNSPYWHSQVQRNYLNAENSVDVFFKVTRRGRKNPSILSYGART